VVVRGARGAVDHCGQPGLAPQLAPAIARVTARTGKPPRAVTADRGYGEAGVEDDLHTLGVTNVVIPRKAKPSAARRELEHRRPFRRLVKWRTGSEGRISTLNADTDGTAANSTASTEPGPGADTGSSPTTWSRSAR
jgi:IS5 family transposase